MAFLTDARLALLAALEADATLSAAVKSWYRWGPGLKHRYSILPKDCPLLSLVPAETEIGQPANVVKGFGQDLELGIATDSQDAEPCETLVAAAIDVIITQGRACLGMADEGVTSIDFKPIRWQAVEDQDSARVRWEAAITLRINWFRQ